MKDDAAVTEVVGFIMMFGLSVVILIVSMQAFLLLRESTLDLTDASELRILATQLASEMALLAKVSNDFPNATFHSTMRVPDLGGRDYKIEATTKTVFINTTDSKVKANSTTFRLDAISNLVVSAKASPSSGLIKVTYAFDLGTNTKTITVKGA